MDIDVGPSTGRQSKWSWWLWWYLLAIALVALRTVLVLVEGCASVQGGLGLGCGDGQIGIDWVFLPIDWGLTTFAASLIGSSVALALRRRPTVRSFIIWVSVGLLGPTAIVYLLSGASNRYMFWVLGVTGLLGTAAGVARSREATSNEKQEARTVAGEGS